MAFAASSSITRDLATMFSRVPFDMQAYRRHVESHDCFICAVADRDSPTRQAHAVIYEDSQFLVFLNRFPTVFGHTLVCPRAHLEQATADFTEDEYLAL